MFNDGFKERYTTIPLAVYRAYFVNQVKEVIAHHHKEFEVISITEGSALFYVDAQEYRLQKGDLLLIPPYAIHRGKTTDRGTASYNCICFDLKIQCDEALKTGLEEHTLSTEHFISKESAYAARLPEYIENACCANERQSLGWELDAIGNISLFLSVLKQEAHFTENLKCSTQKPFAQNVMDYIIAHYASEQPRKARLLASRSPFRHANSAHDHGYHGQVRGIYFWLKAVLVHDTIRLET